MAIVYDGSKLTTKKKAHVRNAWICYGVSLAGDVLTLVVKNKVVRSITYAVGLAGLAGGWYFTGRAEGIDDWNACCKNEDEEVEDI